MKADKILLIITLLENIQHSRPFDSMAFMYEKVEKPARYPKY